MEYEIGQGDSSYPEFLDNPRSLYPVAYLEGLDLIVNAIKDRFGQPGYLMYKNLLEIATPQIYTWTIKITC